MWKTIESRYLTKYDMILSIEMQLLKSLIYYIDLQLLVFSKEKHFWRSLVSWSFFHNTVTTGY